MCYQIFRVPIRQHNESHAWLELFYCLQFTGLWGRGHVITHPTGQKETHLQGIGPLTYGERLEIDFAIEPHVSDQQICCAVRSFNKLSRSLGE